MDRSPAQCRNCGHLNTDACPGTAGHDVFCKTYLSWSDHWMQEMVTIERALRNTYIAAACFAVLAAMTVILPTTLS